LENKAIFLNFVLKEWLAIASGVGLALLIFYTGHLPHYSICELQILFILFVLFIVINGLQKSGLILKIVQSLEKGKNVPLKLVVMTFFMSTIITNDVALMVVVPLTLSLSVCRKDILVILEALAANSGSALTPIGNPQNLFIYLFYDVSPYTFIKTIVPFSLIFLGLLMVPSFFVKTGTVSGEDREQKVDGRAYIYGALLIVVLLTIFHVLPILAGALVIFFVVIFDRGVLRVDYALLFTFLCFFGIADNLNSILATEINHSGHVFLFSALVS